MTTLVSLASYTSYSISNIKHSWYLQWIKTSSSSFNLFLLRKCLLCPSAYVLSISCCNLLIQGMFVYTIYIYSICFIQLWLRLQHTRSIIITLFLSNTLSPLLSFTINFTTSLNSILVEMCVSIFLTVKISFNPMRVCLFCYALFLKKRLWVQQNCFHLAASLSLPHV